MNTNLRPSPILFAPLLANANATITVRSARSWTVDPLTGNRTADTVLEIPVRAILKSGISRQAGAVLRFNVEQIPGIDEKNSLIYGYIVEPQKFPEGVDHNTEARVDFDTVNLATDPRSGLCRLWIPFQNPFVMGDLGIKLVVELIEEN